MIDGYGGNSGTVDQVGLCLGKSLRLELKFKFKLKL